MPATGQWRPPFQQAYTRTSRVRDALPPDHARVEAALRGGPGLPARPGPVVAAAAGTWSPRRADRRATATLVDVDHGGGITSRYAHLARIDPGIRPGRACGSAAGPRRRRLHRHLHRQPPPLRDPPGRHRQSTRSRSWPSTAPPWTGDAVAPPRRRAPGQRPRRPPGRHRVRPPRAGTPRLASLSTPPAPIPATIKALYVAAATGTSCRGRCSPGSGWKRPPTARTPPPPPPAPKG